MEGVQGGANPAEVDRAVHKSCARTNRVRCLRLPRRPAPPCSEARVEVKRAAHKAARAHELAAGLENQLEMAVRQVAALQARSKVRLMCVAVCG